MISNGAANVNLPETDGSLTRSVSFRPNSVTELRLNDTTGRVTRGIADDPTVAVRMNTVRSLHTDVEREFRKEFLISLVTAIPIVIATVILVSFDAFQYAGFDERKCMDAGVLKLWSIVNALRIITQCIVFGYMLTQNVDLSRLSPWHKTRGLLNSLSMLWIVIGLYLIVSYRECSGDVYYSFTLVFVLAECSLSLLPCLLFLLLLPFICLCLPCALRVMVTLQNKDGLGATTQQINKIKTVKYGDKQFFSTAQEHEVKCSICLSDYEKGDVLRVLPCGGQHYFHKECVDSWLLINSTCPYCRGNCFEERTSGTGNV